MLNKFSVPCPLSIVHPKRVILPSQQSRSRTHTQDRRWTLKVYKMGDPEKEEEGKNKDAGTTPPDKVKELTWV